MRTELTRARLCAIFCNVLTRSAMSGLGTRPAGWRSIAGSRALNFAPHPPFLAKQIQPPPYSSRPLMMLELRALGAFALAGAIAVARFPTVGRAHAFAQQ